MGAIHINKRILKKQWCRLLRNILRKKSENRITKVTHKGWLFLLSKRRSFLCTTVKRKNNHYPCLSVVLKTSHIINRPIVYAQNEKDCLLELAARTKDKIIQWKLTQVTLRGYYNKVMTLSKLNLKK